MCLLASALPFAIAQSAVGDVISSGAGVEISQASRASGSTDMPFAAKASGGYRGGHTVNAGNVTEVDHPDRQSEVRPQH
jgi:hypothetical protein